MLDLSTMTSDDLYVLDGWDVVAVDGRGLYIRNGGTGWNVVSDSQLQHRDDELAEVYRSVIND